MENEDKNRLKASLTVIVSDYAKIRYAYVRNTRFRLYRNGIVTEQPLFLPGEDREFAPFISKKIKLVDGDILTLYTRGIWENVEELLLSRQPEFLDNYAFAAIFVNKVFVDPNRKRRIKKIVTISISVATVILILSLVLWMLYRKRQTR